MQPNKENLSCNWHFTESNPVISETLEKLMVQYVLFPRKYFLVTLLATHAVCSQRVGNHSHVMQTAGLLYSKDLNLILVLFSISSLPGLQIVVQTILQSIPGNDKV